MPTVQEAGEDLATPLFRAVSLGVQAESEQDCQTFDLSRIGEVREDLKQAPPLQGIVFIELWAIGVCVIRLCGRKFEPDRQTLSQVKLVEAHGLPLARELLDEVEGEFLWVLRLHK